MNYLNSKYGSGLDYLADYEEVLKTLTDADVQAMQQCGVHLFRCGDSHLTAYPVQVTEMGFQRGVVVMESVSLY